MIDNQIITTVLIHLFTAILQLAFWQKTATQRVLSIVGCFLGFIYSAQLIRQSL